MLPMAYGLVVLFDFPGHPTGEQITDQSLVSAIMAGSYSDRVVRYNLTTQGGSGSNTISGVPTTVQVGATIVGTFTATQVGYYVCIRLNGADVLPRTQLGTTSGSLPVLSAPSTGNATVAMYSAATGGAPIIETGAISVVPTPPPVLVTGAYIDSNGHTIVVLSSGATVDVGILSGSTTPPPITSSRARFAQDTATAGTSTTAAALFASMAEVASPTSDRTGTITTTADQTKYTWVAVLASAAGAGMHFFDGTGYGGFNGANSASVYTGLDADPTTICQTYTDGSGRVWNLYRSSGHSVALTFTLS